MRRDRFPEISTIHCPVPEPLLKFYCAGNSLCRHLLYIDAPRLKLVDSSIIPCEAAAI